MSSTTRRSFLTGSAAAVASLALPGWARAQAHPGVTATELKIGTTTSLSGPVSALGTINKSQAAYFKMLNEQGGIAGRKIDYLILDDGFNPAKTLEQTRRLVEQDEVAFLFSQLGTGPNSAIVKYVNGDDANLPPGPSIPAGSPVVWTWLVTNPGDADLHGVFVADDQGLAVACPKTWLAAGQTMICTGTGTAQAGGHAHLATATGTALTGETAAASDPGHYLGVAP